MIFVVHVQINQFGDCVCGMCVCVFVDNNVIPLT